ncbi:hypothetical protein [Streptomyces sp. NPDC050560]|uniref:hypothetical protein n=1 Tax=Streptomyces sp. NPDC050560 TaxID=3365630 RepID=UPI003787EC13
MSFGDPNNPWGQPPQQPPPQHPPYQQPMGPPGYGYGYPQQPMYPGYPGGTMMQPVMPGLVTTARVLLFIIAAVQVIAGIFMVFAAATVNDASNAADSTFDNDFGNDFADIGHESAGIILVIGLVFLAFCALSITLGAKFGRGAQGVRITTLVYGILGTVLGVLALVGAADSGSSVALVWSLLWIAFGGLIAAAMITRAGAAWFNRPRY